MRVNDNVIYRQILTKTPINYHYLYKITTGENKHKIKLVKMKKLVKFKEYARNDKLIKEIIKVEK